VKLFLAQKVLEEWALGDKADLAEGKLVVKESKDAFPVTPAVHFARVVSGSDAHGLVGRVKTMTQLEGLGAEHMADSVILGEAAYEVETGYITEVPSGPAAVKQDPKKKATSPEADLLAAFILDKL
jgi:hypothetical protein